MNNKQTTEPMVISKTSSTHTAQGIYVQHLKKDKEMSNNQIEQIKQFLHNEICERRDYSASKMCEEVLKFIEQMSNNKIDYQAGLQFYYVYLSR